jgi:hypothetical protein
MALRTPPSWLQQGSHPAENDRLTQQGVYTASGIIGGNSLGVTANATPAMNVNIASGWGAIVSSTSGAGVYVGYNDATVNISVTAADTTNPRIDLVVMTVNDAAYSGTLNNVTFTVVAGTPAASPTAPSTPSNSIVLAQLAVAANATTITNTNITDMRLPVQSNLTQTPVQSVRLTANGSAVSTGGSVFGATTRPLLLAGRAYQVQVWLPALKTTAGTVNLQFTSSTASAITGSLNFTDQPSSDVYVQFVTAGSTNITMGASSGLSNATNYLFTISGTISATANTRINLNATISAGTITPLAGAYMTVTDFGTATNIGNLG